MHKNLDRCDCCGKFASGLYMQLYTLYGIDHPNAEDVAICQKCGDKFTKDNKAAIAWLNARFGQSDEHKENCEQLEGVTTMDVTNNFPFFSSWQLVQIQDTDLNRETIPEYIGKIGLIVGATSYGDGSRTYDVCVGVYNSTSYLESPVESITVGDDGIKVFDQRYPLVAPKFSVGDEVMCLQPGTHQIIHFVTISNLDPINWAYLCLPKRASADDDEVMDYYYQPFQEFELKKID